MAHGQAEKALDRDVTLLAGTHAGQRAKGKEKAKKEEELFYQVASTVLEQVRRLKQNWGGGGV